MGRAVAAVKTVVISWLWAQPNGRAKYTAEHVNIWRGMLERNLSIDHEVACVTDMPEGIDPRVRIIPLPRDFEDVRIPTWREGRPQCFRRLSIFRPDAADLFGAERIVSMDLDVVIAASLDSLFAGAEDFRICRGTASGRSFNGSIYMLRAGSRTKVYTEFTPERAAEAGRRHVGSDQSWLARCLAGAPTWGPEHGVVSIQQRHTVPSPRLVTYPGTLKPWMVAEYGADPMAVRHYRGARRDRCLILGHGPQVWIELDRVLDAAHDGAVIASPEAARHWPGPLLAVAHSDGHAERLAAMHGFRDVVFCGRTEGMAT